MHKEDKFSFVALGLRQKGRIVAGRRLLPEWCKHTDPLSDIGRQSPGWKKAKVLRGRSSLLEICMLHLWPQFAEDLHIDAVAVNNLSSPRQAGAAAGTHRLVQKEWIHYRLNCPVNQLGCNMKHTAANWSAFTSFFVCFINTVASGF